jgi:hypothetical protein
MEPMSSREPRTYLLYLVGVILAGAFILWVVKVLVSLLFYVVVGALVVGCVAYFARRPNGSLRGSGRGRIGR